MREFDVVTRDVERALRDVERSKYAAMAAQQGLTNAVHSGDSDAVVEAQNIVSDRGRRLSSDLDALDGLELELRTVGTSDIRAALLTIAAALSPTTDRARR